MIFEPILISIGLPVVKPQFLKQAIECCLQQTYTNIEIIIQNNAKEDITKNKIKEIVSNYKDTRIKYFETVNQIPMVENWNDILNKANGEFFAILCDDDKWHPDFLKEMLLLSQKYPNTNLFHSRVIFINEDDSIIGLSPSCPEYEDGLDFIYHRVAGFRRIYLSDFMIRTKSLKRINGFYILPDGWGSDDITWFKIGINGGVCYSPKELFYYRESSFNISNNKSINNKLVAIDYQYDEIIKIINTISNSLKTIIIKQHLKSFKGNRKYSLWIKLLNQRFLLPVPLAKMLAMVLRFIAFERQKKLYNI